MRNFSRFAFFHRAHHMRSSVVRMTLKESEAKWRNFTVVPMKQLVLWFYQEAQDVVRVNLPGKSDNSSFLNEAMTMTI